ncbi:MAG: heterodisulfide reductase subunit C, partial [Deltaproteobacteria bacterium]
FVQGIKNTLEMVDMGITMFLHRRMKPLPERPIKGIKGLRKMLDKAAQMGKGGASAS